jgi:hypothetical protein
MDVRWGHVVAVAGLLAATPAKSNEPEVFSCNFNNGTTYAYEKGAYVSEAAAPLKFGISSINLQAQTADLNTTRGTGSLRIVRAVNATHFLEVVTEGFMHITTVYDRDDDSGSYPAVHSRHFGILGQPVVTQYHGFCEAKG